MKLLVINTKVPYMGLLGVISGVFCVKTKKDEF